MKVEQQARVVTFTDKHGNKFHYVYIGGLYYYNGTKKCGDNMLQQYKDGFWSDESIKSIMTRTRSTKEALYFRYPKSIYKAVERIRRWDSSHIIYY